MSTQKTALVTGANKGIGYALVKELKAKGYDVWLGARNAELGATAARELGAHFLSIDVTNSESVTAAFAEYTRSNTSLDLLINNAGVYLLGRDTIASEATLESIRETYEVNVLGAVRVTQTFLPALRQAKDSQIWNISSGMGSNAILNDPVGPLNAFPPAFGYSSSKAALNTFTIMLANELRSNGIRVNSICPGYVSTDMNAYSGSTTPDTSAQNIVSRILSPNFMTGKFVQTHGLYPW